MQKRAIVLLTSSIVMLLLSTVTFVFAWFTIVEKTQKIIISSGNVKMDYSLEEEIDNERYQITQKITYQNTVPGDNYKYYLNVKNTGNITALLSINMIVSSSSSIGKNFILEYTIDSFISADLSSNRSILTDYRLDKNKEFSLEFIIKFSNLYEGNSINEFLKIDRIELTLVQEN